MGKFIIIIWHQAGGRDNKPTFYTWEDHMTECAYVFSSEEIAKKEWRESGLNEVHAAFIVDCDTKKQVWI